MAILSPAPLLAGSPELDTYVVLGVDEITAVLLAETARLA